MDALKYHILATKADIRLCESYPKLFCNAVLNELEQELLDSKRTICLSVRQANLVTLLETA